MTKSLGKGEVESSILSCSTINTNKNNTITHIGGMAVQADSSVNDSGTVARNWQSQTDATAYSREVAQAFWGKVAINPDADACWEWTRSTKRYGYGRVKIGGRAMIASRVAWELANDEALGDRFALHTCDNPKCCKPAHILAGDHAENMRQARERSRFRTSPQRGEMNNRAKLSAADVLTIREMIARGAKNTAIAAAFGVSHGAISNIRRGVSWAL